MQYGNGGLKEDKKYKQISLNRTMQYGNLRSGGNASKNPCMFKSYYVVWKQIKYTNTSIPNNGLNRTMQYGNFPSTKYSKKEDKV